MSDPVAEKSGFLQMYMSNHPDTLVAYAKWFGKVTEDITSAEMSAITSKGMILTCTMKGGLKKEIEIRLDPPLSGYHEVKPRLLEMKAVAQEELGMIKTPQITSFRLIPEATPVGIIVSCLIYLNFFPKQSSSSLFVPARIAASFIGCLTLNLIFYVILVAHILESIYTFTLCRRHQTGFVVGTMYVLATIYFGFPVWKDLRKQIQVARIESVMKVE